MPRSAPALGRAELEDRLVELVSRSKVRTSQLMEQVKTEGMSAADAREAVWALLEDGRLQLTPDRHLEIP